MRHNHGKPLCFSFKLHERGLIQSLNDNPELNLLSDVTSLAGPIVVLLERFIFSSGFQCLWRMLPRAHIFVSSKWFITIYTILSDVSQIELENLFAN